MYATKEEYTALYGDITDAEFNRVGFDASRLMDIATTGIDNIKKLKVAMPTDADDAAIVSRCCCKLVNILKQISDAEASAASARGYTQGENGFQGKTVSSLSAGNESISYASTSDSAVDKAVSDMSERNRLVSSIIREYLSGVSDANGVNLLYLGRYPGVVNV